MKNPTPASIAWPAEDLAIVKDATKVLGITFSAFVRQAAATELQRAAELTENEQLRQLAEKHKMTRLYRR